MKILKSTILSLLFCLSSLLIFAQDCSNIFSIAEGSIFNASGLGFRFQGAKANDGDLYFRGSINGTALSVWKTNGTAAGTSKVIEETNMFGGNWDNLHFIDEGVLIQDDDDWMLVGTGANAITMLPQFTDLDLEYIGQATNGKYYLAGDSGDDVDAVEYDPSNNTATIISDVHPGSSSLNVFPGDHGVLFYSIFGEASTTVLLTDINEVQNINTYLANLGYVVADYNGGSIYDKYMYATFRDDQGGFNHLIINMDNNEVISVGESLQGVISHIEHNNYIYFIGNNGIVKLDTNQFTSTSVFDDVYAFSPIIIFDNQLMGAGDNPSNDQLQIAAIDVETDQLTYLPGAFIGESFLNPKLAEFDNNFYYIARENGEHILNRYDFASNQPVLVGALSEVTGATVEHALVEVQGNLVTSTRFNNLQHELAFCGEPVDVVDIEPTTIAVFPSPATDYIQFSENEISGANKNVFIHNASGSTASMKTMDGNGVLDITGLACGFYFGSLLIDGEKRSFKFVKM